MTPRMIPSWRQTITCMTIFNLALAVTAAWIMALGGSDRWMIPLILHGFIAGVAGFCLLADAWPSVPHDP